jgi:undecaprenyl-diphosphatase
MHKINKGDFVFLQIDFSILNSIQGIRNGFLDFLMPIITFLGNGGMIWILSAAVMLFFKRTRKMGIAVGIALLIGLLLSTFGIKYIVARERPFNTDGALLNEMSLLISAPAGRFSFPSGHTLSSFSAAVVMLCYNKKLGIPAIVLASLIAFSRLYLYVHFPSDVLGGIVIGTLFAFTAVFLTNKIWEKTYERKLPNNT